MSALGRMNAELIKQGIPQNMRLVPLNKMAIEQMTSILGSSAIKYLRRTQIYAPIYAPGA